MDSTLVETIAAVFTAIGTVSVAILAIWGDKVIALLAGPKLELLLLDPGGDLTVRGNGKRTFYYHILVKNGRTWRPAKAVRLLVVGIAKRRPDGTFFPERVVIPLQLSWAHANFHELFPTIVSTDTCDFGFIDEDAGRFALTLYFAPNNFRGYVERDEAIRVHIVASGQNYYSRKPLILEVSWNGKWSADRDEMQRHLVIKEVAEGESI